MKPKVLLSWSSGKDSAWALHVLWQRGEVEIVGLVTTLNEAFERVAMHGVRAELVQAQADAAGLSLWPVPLPWPCSNAEYETRMRAVIEKARSERVTAFAFGDLFLADIRAYRERQLAGTGLEPLFPIWDTSAGTPTLACVEPARLLCRPTRMGPLGQTWSARRAPQAAGERGARRGFGPGAGVVQGRVRREQANRVPQGSCRC
jgi:hypothetical protein